jgi:flagellar hook-associated protein 3 FlgL
MRITNSILVNSFMGDMNRNLNNMHTIQKQQTSGKEFSRPSDNPFKVARSMQMYSEIYANKQYNSNIKETINWMDSTDAALGQATSSLQRIRELMISAGDAAYGSKELSAIKDEINEKVAEFGQILNTSFDGKYIFGGTDGTTKPVVVDATSGSNVLQFNSSADLNNIKKSLSVEISVGVNVEYNINASQVIDYGPGKSVSNLLSDIMTHLNDPTQKSSVTGADLGEMDKAIDNLLSLSSKVGAIQNRMESAKGLNEEQNFNMTEILSANEDIDIVEKSMEYATMQTIYLASLQTSAKVIQPTLMDYLR